MKIVADPAFRNRARNPYNWLLYSHMAAEVVEFSYRLIPDRRTSILHVHWPERELNARRSPLMIFARLCLKLLAIRCWRARGTRIVWTAHNVHSHEQRYPRLERWFWRHFTSALDGVIALSRQGLDATRREHRRLASLPGFVIPHGHYRGEYPCEAALDARRALGVDANARVLVFFGKIRPYKNVSGLIEAFRQLKGEGRTLYIAGEPCDAAMAHQIRTLAATDARIHLRMEHVPKEQVQVLLHAADLVVLPFMEIDNSGSALLALSFDRPILVPAMGAMRELAGAVSDDWVRTYSGPLTSEILERALDWASRPRTNGSAPLDCLAWESVSALTLAAFEQIAGLQPAGAESDSLCDPRRRNGHRHA